MKQVLISVGIFSAGVGLGVLATRTYFEKKYQQIADEEVESVKKVYSKRDPVKKDEDSDGGMIVSGEGLTIDYRSLTADAISYHDHYSKEEEKVNEAKTLSPVEEEVYEISPDDFADDTDYDKVTLNLYTEDGVLIYEEGEEMVDESIIGSENIDDFSNTPFAQTYLRDPKNKIDYEIIKVDGSYHELIAGNF